MKNNVERLLDTAGVTYIVHEYPVDDGLIDGMSIAAKIGKPAEQVFKTLVTEAPGHEYFVFIVPACNELDLKKAARACGRKSIATITPRAISEKLQLTFPPAFFDMARILFASLMMGASPSE